MEKQKTVVHVAGREYTLISADEPAYLKRVAALADRTIRELAAATHMPENSAAVMACLTLSDELMRSKEENSRLRRELAMQRQEEETK